MPGSVPDETSRVLRELEHAVPRLARAVVTEFLGPRADGPTVPELLRTTVPHTVRHFMRLFLHVAAEGREVVPEDLALLAERARERAGEGVRFDQMLAAHQAMAAVLLRAFQERFHGGAAELGAFAERVQQGTGLAMTVSLQAFQDETQASLLAGADLAVELAEDLLAGRPAATRAAALGIRLPQDFTVLALQIGQDPEEAAASPGYRGTAAARKARRVRAALAAELPGPLLSAARPGHLLVLAPGPAERALLTRIHRRIARTVAAPLRVGAVWAARPADIPAAANGAIEITRLATAFDLPEDAFQLVDVALPWQLSQNTAAAALMQRRFAPALQDADLADTLTAFLANDFDRRRTAQAQAVHPNTVDNRLRRAARLCGVDLTTSTGLLSLSVALARRRVEGVESVEAEH